MGYTKACFGENGTNTVNELPELNRSLDPSLFKKFFIQHLKLKTSTQEHLRIQTYLSRCKTENLYRDHWHFLAPTHSPSFSRVNFKASISFYIFWSIYYFTQQTRNCDIVSFYYTIFIIIKIETYICITKADVCVVCVSLPCVIIYREEAMLVHWVPPNWFLHI